MEGGISERMELVIPSFHTGIKQRVLDFCKDDNSMLLSNHKHDNKWAGPGMYFWDNLGNAKWWLSTRHDKENRTICQCYLKINEVELLDFTDMSIAESMQKLIVIMEKNEEVFALDEVGIKIAFLAKRLNSKAIKLMGDYPNMKRSDFFSSPAKGAVPNISSRVIYCVREGNSDILVSRKEIGSA